MIRTLPTAPVMAPHKAVARYLEGLAALTLEVAAQPRLWPTYCGILARVPRTLAELLRERRLAA